MFELKFTKAAESQFRKIEKHSSLELKKRIRASLGMLQTNPKHSSLAIHPYDSIDYPFDSNPKGKVFGIYIQEKDLSSRILILCCPGPNKKQITVLAITPYL